VIIELASAFAHPNARNRSVRLSVNIAFHLRRTCRKLVDGAYCGLALNEVRVEFIIGAFIKTCQKIPILIKSRQSMRTKRRKGKRRSVVVGVAEIRVARLSAASFLFSRH